MRIGWSSSGFDYRLLRAVKSPSESESESEDEGEPLYADLFSVSALDCD